MRVTVYQGWRGQHLLGGPPISNSARGLACKYESMPVQSPGQRFPSGGRAFIRAGLCSGQLWYSRAQQHTVATPTWCRPEVPLRREGPPLHRTALVKSGTTAHVGVHDLMSTRGPSPGGGTRWGPPLLRTVMAFLSSYSSSGLPGARGVLSPRAALGPEVS